MQFWNCSSIRYFALLAILPILIFAFWYILYKSILSIFISYFSDSISSAVLHFNACYFQIRNVRQSTILPFENPHLFSVAIYNCKWRSCRVDDKKIISTLGIVRTRKVTRFERFNDSHVKFTWNFCKKKSKMLLPGRCELECRKKNVKRWNNEIRKQKIKSLYCIEKHNTTLWNIGTDCASPAIKCLVSLSCGTARMTEKCNKTMVLNRGSTRL